MLLMLQAWKYNILLATAITFFCWLPPMGINVLWRRFLPEIWMGFFHPMIATAIMAGTMVAMWIHWS